MNYQAEQPNFNSSEKNNSESFDYSYVNSTARVAVYDDLKMAPRIFEINPAPTNEFIESLTTCIYEQGMKRGGKIPYSAIREVSENFIHARFREIVVSVLDGGNTIRFCDQGPGIQNKDKAKLPGFTSAIEPMKHYIRGVGSGLPLVKEYLDYSDGKITIEDNLNAGSVVTITLEDHASQTPLRNTQPQSVNVNNALSINVPVPPLNDREKNCLSLFYKEGALGVKDVSSIMGLASSSTYALFTKLEEAGLIEKSTYNKKRLLTDYGNAVSQQLQGI